MKVYIVVSCSSDYDFNIEGIFESYEGALTCIEERLQNKTRPYLHFCVIMAEETQKKKAFENQTYFIKRFKLLARNSEEALEIGEKKYSMRNVDWEIWYD